MKINENTLLQIISLLVVIFLALYKNPTSTTFNLVLFISIIVSAVLLISINWVLGNVEKIDENTKSIRRLESKLDVMEKVNNLSGCISKIEGWKEVFDKIKQKKAQINPQLILVILIIILIILYLRSQGNT